MEKHCRHPQASFELYSYCISKQRGREIVFGVPEEMDYSCASSGRLAARAESRWAESLCSPILKRVLLFSVLLPVLFGLSSYWPCSELLLTCKWSGHKWTARSSSVHTWNCSVSKHVSPVTTCDRLCVRSVWKYTRASFLSDWAIANVFPSVCERGCRAVHNHNKR